jgi:hypothetical protein
VLPYTGIVHEIPVAAASSKYGARYLPESGPDIGLASSQADSTSMPISLSELSNMLIIVRFFGPMPKLSA